jgi:hypothetical protein
MFELERPPLVSTSVSVTSSHLIPEYGDRLRSKADTTMVNESLAKILCHNICCMIQSMFELGIEAKFWEAEKATDVVGATAATDLVEAWDWV